MSVNEVQQPAEGATVRVITETRNLKAQPFTPGEDHINTGKAWDEWLEEIEREFRYFKISDPLDKKDALLIYGGKEVARLEKSLPNPDGELNEYEKLRTKLNNYFKPKKNKHHARYLFSKLRPIHGETIAAYASRLREKANDCEFEGTCEERILEHLIQTTHKRTLIQKAINKKWNLSQFLTEAIQTEDTSLQINDMRITEDVKFVNKAKGERQLKRQTQYRGKPTAKPCGYCGQVGTHDEGKNCPAYGKRCKKSGKYNHFALVCKSANQPGVDWKGQGKGLEQEQRQTKFTNQRRQVKKASEETTDSSTSSDDEFFCQAVRHIKQVKKVKTNLNTKTVTVKVEDIDVRVEPDSGAEVNVMDEHQFKALTNRCRKEITLEHSRTKLNTLQNQLPVKGEFKATIRNRTCGTVSRFIVVKGRSIHHHLSARTLY